MKVGRYLKDLNKKVKTLKVLEENIGININELVWCNGFLAIATKIHITKEKNRYIGHYQNENLWSFEGHDQESEITTYRMGEIFCKSYI